MPDLPTHEVRPAYSSKGAGADREADRAADRALEQLYFQSGR
jgi:hypothetical protein